MDIIKETNFAEFGELKRGKVRDIYTKSDKVVLVATDRHSSFDRIIAHVPRKGEVLNLLTAFWTEKVADIVPNHILAVPDQNVTVAKKYDVVPVEAVVRGYLTGVTSTSIWTHYQEGKRDYGNFILPDGMKKNQKLEKPVFTPSTKEDAHDRTLSPKEIVEEGIVSKEIIDQVEEIALRLFERGQAVAAESGLILVDTKYEFGMSEDGSLVLIDEVHTPDSSRYWYVSSYEERFNNGEEPEYFDKEFLRTWFKENSDPYNDETLPDAPEEMVEELSKRYQKIYTQLTGEKLKPIKGDQIARMENNIRTWLLTH